MKPETIRLAEKFASFSETWSPRIVAEANGQHMRIAKLSGDFVWHSHADEDELFLVLKGRLRVDFRDGEDAYSREVGPGELLVVPRGLEHRPATVGDEIVHLINFTRAETKHTGEVKAGVTIDVAAMPRI